MASFRRKTAISLGLVGSIFLFICTVSALGTDLVRNEIDRFNSWLRFEITHQCVSAEGRPNPTERFDKVRIKVWTEDDESRGSVLITHNTEPPEGEAQELYRGRLEPKDSAGKVTTREVELVLPPNGEKPTTARITITDLDNRLPVGSSDIHDDPVTNACPKVSGAPRNANTSYGFVMSTPLQN
jgi:hypothetical protein